MTISFLIIDFIDGSPTVCASPAPRSTAERRQVQALVGRFCVAPDSIPAKCQHYAGGI
jgi:hypothetical protein